MTVKPRIAVVSPFLDKRHGTEHCVAEQVERLAGDFDIHIYSMCVEDVDLSRLRWHRIPNVPGPHLFRYLWWFAANHAWRWWHRRFQDIGYDLIFSPGVNCLDADVIAVHIVFSEFYERVKSDLSLRSHPIRSWPRLLHRRVYYRLVIALERLVYRRKTTQLVAVSRKVAEDLKRWYGVTGSPSVVYDGTDLERFCPTARSSRRRAARESLQLTDEAFALLLVGNDWTKKGLPCLLEGLETLANPHVRLLVVGQDDPTPYRKMLVRAGLSQSVAFLPIRADVEFYYAVADAYVGPSLEDAFSMPPLEAMASGLPVIVSRMAGVSEIITHGLDGFVLEHPQDPDKIVDLIRRLVEDRDLCRKLGENAQRTAGKYSWARNAAEMKGCLESALSQ